MLHSPAPSNANIAADQILAIPMIRGSEGVLEYKTILTILFRLRGLDIVGRSRNMPNRCQSLQEMDQKAMELVMVLSGALWLLDFGI